MRLDKNDLCEMVMKSIKMILREGSGNYSNYYGHIEVYSDDILQCAEKTYPGISEDEDMEKYLETLPYKFEISVNFTCTPIDRGDYYTPPSGGDIDNISWELENYDLNKLPQEISDMISTGIDDYLNTTEGLETLSGIVDEEDSFPDYYED